MNPCLFNRWKPLISLALVGRDWLSRAFGWYLGRFFFFPSALSCFLRVYDRTLLPPEDAGYLDRTEET
jgi:hypothetical protein